MQAQQTAQAISEVLPPCAADYLSDSLTPNDSVFVLTSVLY